MSPPVSLGRRGPLLALTLLATLAATAAPRVAAADEPAQNEPPALVPAPPSAPVPAPPAPAPLPAPAPEAAPVEPPAAPSYAPPPDAPPPPVPEPEEPREEMSEGRRIVSAWNSGFQWGLSPGVGFSNGKAGFLLGARVGYGFDTGTVILVPAVHASAYFLDPTVLIGMPMFRVIFPLNRFAPFVEGGVGVGHVAGLASQTGAALSGGGGFMLHFTRSFALGAEATYQVITGTNFKGVAIGPIIAFAF